MSEVVNSGPHPTRPISVYWKPVQAFGQSCTFGCDGRCDKAWGMSQRPTVQLSDDENDFVYLTDVELGIAPEDPGTTEDGERKPASVVAPNALNKWCFRECERSKSSAGIPTLGMLPSFVLDDFDNPTFNRDERSEKYQGPVTPSLIKFVENILPLEKFDSKTATLDFDGSIMVVSEFGYAVTKRLELKRLFNATAADVIATAKELFTTKEITLPSSNDSMPNESVSLLRLAEIWQKPVDFDRVANWRNTLGFRPERAKSVEVPIPTERKLRV